MDTIMPVLIIAVIVISTLVCTVAAIWITYECLEDGDLFFWFISIVIDIFVVSLYIIGYQCIVSAVEDLSRA